MDLGKGKEEEGILQIGSTTAPLLQKDFEPRFEESISKRATKWLLTFGGLLLSFVFGFIIASIWDLQGKISEVIGKQETQSIFIQTLIADKKELERENKEYSKEIAELKMQNAFASKIGGAK